MAAYTTDMVLQAWKEGFPIPGGWTVEVEDDDEGGQRNGSGEVESSDSREWFSDERESHHRMKIVVTMLGPWEEGPTRGAAVVQKNLAERRAREKKRAEDNILEQAEKIRARRTQEAKA